MANFTFRNHQGLTGGYGGNVRSVAHSLVQQAAVGVNWNRLGIAPGGFTMKNVGGNMRPIHEKTDIEFKPGFSMYETTGSQKWEGRALADGLRLDLQSINNGWANWAVQTNVQNSRTVATCLMAVEKSFSQSQLAHALIQSAERHQLCELTQGE